MKIDYIFSGSDLGIGRDMQEKLPGIQYLRAIAAIAVAVDHAAAMAAFEKYFGSKILFYDFLVKGALGVNLFFVISGFIIVVSSLSEGTLLPRKKIGDFFAARFIRIIPMMWLAIVSYALLRVFGRSGDYALQPYVNAFFLLPVGDYDPNNIWTLRQEIIFYIVFAISFLSVAVWRKFILLAWCVFSFVSFDFPASWMSELYRHVFFIGNPLFVLGVLAGMVYLRLFAQLRKWSYSLIETSRGLVGLLVVFLGSVALGVAVDAKVDDSSAVLMGVIYAPLVLVAAMPLEKTRALVLYLGNASYAIYLFHLHIQSAALGVVSKFKSVISVEFGVVFVVFFSVGVGCIIYSFVEMPLTRFVNRRYKAHFA